MLGLRRAGREGTGARRELGVNLSIFVSGEGRCRSPAATVVSSKGRKVLLHLSPFWDDWTDFKFSLPTLPSPQPPSAPSFPPL